jgi:hypothetical protein
MAGQGEEERGEKTIEQKLCKFILWIQKKNVRVSELRVLQVRLGRKLWENLENLLVRRDGLEEGRNPKNKTGCS